MTKAIVYLVAILLGLLGLMFIVGAQGQIMRIAVGILLFGGGAALIFIFRTKPTQVTITQKIDLSGDVNLEQLKCKSCGGNLTSKSVAIKAGAVFVTCEYCGSSYQIEEEPKW